MTEAGALHGLRVLDLTRVLAGPYCTMMLGDLGAEIIKVEAPRGDDTRAWGPPYLGAESAYFLGVNRNKRGIVLDLSKPPGVVVLKRLAQESDVLVENFRTGTLEGWGLDDAWAAAHAPRLIRCSITGYGRSGPRARAPGYDFILQAETGLMGITGEPDGAPMKLGVAIVDLTTGLLACNAIQAALIARGRTGLGQRVEVSLMESGLAMLANVAANHLASGEEAARFGNGHPNIVPYRAFGAADAPVAVAVGNDAQFARFAALCGRPDWAEDPAFRRNRDRVANRARLDAAIEAVFAARRAEEWIAALEDAGIPCGRVNTVSEALAQPQALARGMLQRIAHPGLPGGAFAALGFPMKLEDTPCAVRAPPPLLGQHTSSVLRDVLGLDAAALAELAAAGAIPADTPGDAAA
jgi:crotonobetainyl-CoA:carnitine CoA-transferase CaiB-like acyl-CoA transferase